MSETLARKRILDFLGRYPAVHVRELERQLGLSNRLASYHLDRLEEEHRVDRIREPGFTRFLTTQAHARISRADLELLCILRRAPALHICVTLLAEGAQTHGAISKTLGLAKASTSYQVAALAKAGVLRVRSVGRERWYEPTDAPGLRQFLAQYHPTPGTLDAFSSMWNDLFPRRRRT